MWRWVARLLSSPSQPLEHPQALAGTCDTPDSDDPAMTKIRAIQHDADGVVAGVRARRQMEERARLRILEKGGNPRGIGRED